MLIEAEKNAIATDTKPADAPAAARLPLFYQKPEPLRADLHVGLRLSAQPDFRFAAGTNAVPIMASEFVAAARSYPIVFGDGPAMPLVVLGLQSKNLSVTDEGAWRNSSSYIPAYVQRYPFCFIQQGTNFILGVDLACERLVQSGKGYKSAEPLFLDGKPSGLTQEALRFSSALQTDHVATQTFAAALVEHNLLIDQAARAVSEHGRQYNLQGFRIVDVNRFHALPDTVVLEWHRKGWLGLVHAHLASLMAWKDLVTLIGAQEDVSEGQA